jgi:L-amino acid N-acyltransferase YncA
MVLESEYEKRRTLPRHLRRAAPIAPAFDYEIRPANEEDLPHTLALYRHWVRNSVVTFDEQPPSLRTYRSRFRHFTKHGFPFLVAESPRGEILGFAQVQPFRQKSAFRKTVESSIYLSPATTGKGLGTNLLAALIDACEKSGIREIIAVIADQGAEASLALHEKFGFVETGRMQKVGYKFERWVGIILLQKSLRAKK